MVDVGRKSIPGIALWSIGKSALWGGLLLTDPVIYKAGGWAGRLNGKTRGWQSRNRGSIPLRSTNEAQ